MCAIEIFGITLLKGEHKKALDKTQIINLFNRLALRASNKTHDIAGLVSTSDIKFNILRENTSIELLMAEQSYLDFINRIEENSTYSIFGYSTSKSFGKIKDTSECCPLVADNIVGLVEGTISTVSSNLLPNTKKSEETQIDLIPKLFNYYKNMYALTSYLSLKRLFEKIDGGFTAVLLNALSPSSVHIIKTGNSPFSMFLFKEHGLILYAAISSYVLDAVKSANLNETGEQVMLGKRTGVSICADSCRYEKFLL